MGNRIGLFVRKNGSGNLMSDWAAVEAAIRYLVGAMPDPEPPPTQPIGRGHVRTELSQDGRVVVPEGSPSQELSDAIQRWFPRDVWGDAARVSYYESHWSPTAELNTLARGGGRCGVRYWYSDEVGWATTEQSVGYFQINVCAHGHDREYWQDAEHNVAKASGLYHDEGWRPWRVTATRLGLLEGG